MKEEHEANEIDEDMKGLIDQCLITRMDALDRLDALFSKIRYNTCQQKEHDDRNNRLDHQIGREASFTDAK